MEAKLGSNNPDFNIKEIWEVINLLPLHYIINNPIEDKYLEIYIKDISLDDRAKISSIISNYRTLKAKSE